MLCQDSQLSVTTPKELSNRTPGVRLHLTGPTVSDTRPARGRVRCHHVSRRRKHSDKTAGGPGPPTGSRTPIYYPDPSAGREQTPRLGGPEPPRVRRRRYVSDCQASSGRLGHLPQSMREALSALCHSRARGYLCQAVLLVARYQGAQYSRWRHSRHARQTATPVRHDNQRRSIITPTR